MLFPALVLALASAAAPAPADSLNYDADPYFILTEEADSALARQDWAVAAERLRDAMRVRPDAPTNALLKSNLAVALDCMGQDSLALATYDEVLSYAPRMLTPRLGRGGILLRMGRDVEAFDDFSEAVDIDSLCVDARYYRGMIALYAGNRDLAERDFAVLVRVAPEASDTHIALATLYSLTGRDREAIPHLEKLIDTDPAPEFLASLAGCYLGLGELSKAAEVISRGLKLYPRDPELYYYRAWLNRDRFRLDDARRDARRAVQLGASPTRVADLLPE